MARKRPSTARCPHCGRTFPSGRPACPECGSDAETGWREDADDSYWSADIPDAFTEEDYLRAVGDLPGATIDQWPKRRIYLFVVGLITATAFLLTSL